MSFVILMLLDSLMGTMYVTGYEQEYSTLYMLLGCMSFIQWTVSFIQHVQWSLYFTTL